MEEIYKRLAEWESQNKRANLTQIEEAIDEELARVRKALLEEMVNNKEVEGEQSCPSCGKRMLKNGKRKRELRTKNGDRVIIEREQKRCGGCGKTFFPPR